jgi:hypothetical protein
VPKMVPDGVISHWHRPFDKLPTTPLEFYAAVELALDQRKLPDTYRVRVKHRESIFPGSASREYLRVGRRLYYFDICAGPMGTGFFVSWWHFQGEPRRWFFAIPLIGPLIKSIIKAKMTDLTLYQLDTALMFQGVVHNSVLAVIDTYTSSCGIRPLSEFERKPIMREFHDR